jgi:hypothetical protein
MRCRPATILLTMAVWASLLAAPTMAGPWARGSGEGFLAFTVTSDSPTTALMTGNVILDTYAGLYGEYGLGRRLTLGAQIGRSDTADETVIFLRYTLTQPEASWQVAIDGGAGLRNEAGRPDRHLARLGLSIGRGFGGMETGRWWLPVAHDGGWVALDAVGMLDSRTSEPIWHAEATVGLSLSDRLLVMLQAKAEEWPDSDPIYTVTPSAAWSLTDRTTAQVGARLGLGRVQTVGLSLGLWHSF